MNEERGTLTAEELAQRAGITREALMNMAVRAAEPKVGPSRRQRRLALHKKGRRS